jgi:hypothetical protein
MPAIRGRAGGRIVAPPTSGTVKPRGVPEYSDTVVVGNGGGPPVGSPANPIPPPGSKPPIVRGPNPKNPTVRGLQGNLPAFHGNEPDYGSPPKRV